MVFKVDRIRRAKFFTTAAFTANEINALRRIDAIFKRNGLGIPDINRFAFIQAGIISIGDFLGAFLGTGAAGDTFFHVHVSRALDQIDFKMAFFTANADYFCQRQQFDINVSADLDQFR